MTGPTREVLGLAQHRIIGLVHGQLRSSERTRDSYFSLFQSYDADPRPEPDLTSKPGPIGTLDVTAHLNRLTEESFTHPDFVESLAESLPKEFASLLWAKLVESVIVDPLCDFVRFAQFYRAYKGSAMVISFEPAINELTYPKSAPPRIEEFFGAEKASEERMDIRCRQFLTTSLSGPPLSMSNSGDSSSLYPLALPELLRLGLPSLASDVLGSQPTLAGSAIKHDPCLEN